MKDAQSAASFALARASSGSREEIGADDLLLGCFASLAQFGILQLGPWTLDLEAFGIDWLQPLEPGKGKIRYAEPVLEIFSRAARIARAEGAASVGVDHLLAAFAAEESGLAGELKRTRGISSASWRAAVAQLARPAPGKQTREPGLRPAREYLTPEEAAEVLGVHVQTLRAYVRSGKLPAHRLAGERAIRIRRKDLEAVLERVAPGGVGKSESPERP